MLKLISTKYPEVVPTVGVLLTQDELLILYNSMIFGHMKLLSMAKTTRTNQELDDVKFAIQELEKVLNDKIRPLAQDMMAGL